MEPWERTELDGQLAREIQRFNEQLAAWHAENPWDQRDEFDAMNPAQQARLLELEKGERGFLPRSVVSATLEYVQKLVVWIVLGVVLLLIKLIIL